MKVNHPRKGVRPRFRPRGRRGVLLLVVLGLLAMFALVAVAFVVVTGHAMRSSLPVHRIGQYHDPAPQLLNQAAMQALRGTNNPASVMRPHSLLEDIYGRNTVAGVVAPGDNPSPACGGQLIEFIANVSDPHRRVGCVLTMLNGPARGQSTRIVGYIPETKRFQILAFEDVRTDALLNYLSNNACNYVINGTPFSGTGFGFNPASTTGLLDAPDPGEDRNGNGTLDPGEDLNGNNLLDPGPPYALLPNPVAFRAYPPLGYTDPAGPGGANEDYDAVDYQNMLLAMVRPDTGQTVIPSLHRPALVRYWVNQSASHWNNNPDLFRRVILRPLRSDHPNFTGSNPGQLRFNPGWDGLFVDRDNNDFCDFAWDVDNDGDGVADGIWVDLGMPVRSTADGRLYKPLFSFLCLDMDGRLNLNAHGCLAQADPTDALGGQNGGPNKKADYYDPVTLTGNFSFLKFAGSTSSPSMALLPRGQGYGPAEINLGILFASSWSSLAGIAQYREILLGNGVVAGRYGAPLVPGRSGDDPLSWNKSFEYRHPAMGNFWTFLLPGGGYQPDAYGSPPNWKGTGAIGLDMAGRPLYWGVDSFMAAGNEQVDDPYEIDLSPCRAHGLSTQAPIDNPFSVTELERLLRPYDRDSSRLPGRLAALAPSLFSRRHEITTESWDLPCPNLAMPKQLRDALPGTNKWPTHVTDLLRAKNVPQDKWNDLLPPEMLAGQRMDLNRPFGDGRDDPPQNGVVDEPNESVNGENLTQFDKPNSSVDVLFDHDNDGTPGARNAWWPRMLHARYLYVLMMLVADLDALDKLPDGRGQPQGRAGTARMIAQWAVNVVDFRDRDSIMTFFPYDPNPFDEDGFRPPGLQYMVWGCERPELLITETLAFHDRRTEDRADEEHDPNEQGDTSTESGTTGEKDDNKRDFSFDQKKRPQGSLFVELYNPWTNMEPPPGEFYNVSAPLNRRGVVLRQTTPGGHPVWRLIIVKPEGDPTNPGEQADLDDPVKSDQPDIDRSVYFIDLSSSGFDDPKDGRTYYLGDPSKIAPVMPGRYAVVGSGGPTASGGSYPTYIGERNDGDPSPPRRVVLRPSDNPNAVQVEVLDNKNGAVTDLPVAAIKPPAAVVINRPRRLSVSEPIGGYGSLDGGEPYDEAKGGYETPLDVPLDTQSDIAAALLQTGTWEEPVGVLHLQRLANPLQNYNPNLNPYRTIDSMPIYVTAFNGVESPSDYASAGDVGFPTCQRGEKEQPPPPDIGDNLWKQEPVARKPRRTTGGISGHHFGALLEHTLGYLNQWFGGPYNNPQIDPRGWYKGDPPRPFPWLTWNNRPFVSQLELLLVPALRSSKLLVRNETQPQKYYGFVSKLATPPADPAPYAPTKPENVPFPHLLNFFHSARSDASGTSPQLHRLLEYVHVPSRYVGTELQGNPTKFTSGNHSFHPPFNRISRYREPGRINLNTIFSRDVFFGLMNNFPFPQVNGVDRWDHFVQSRRGATNVTDMLVINPNSPTRFENPFRSFAGGDLVPLPELKPAREIDATLLRPNPDDTRQPLFHYEHAAVAPAAYPDDTDRNPYFRYQGLQRLGNLVTTRSNVYAIWITVGYFQVEPNPGGVDPAHPDGYRLGPELGIETGEVERHRAFYFFDRSIPVGFQRGQDLNVERAILLKRFIE